MKRLMLIASMAAVTTGFAVPTVKTGSVTLAQDPNTRVVTVNYTLESEAGIVTVDFLTNGVSIGYANINYLAGDVNKKVATGSRSFTWRPDKSWPGHRIDSASVTAVVTAWSVTAPPDYMVVDLSGSKSIRYYPAEAAVPFGVSNDLYKTDYLLMRKIPAANVIWRMGAAADAQGVSWMQKPHEVTLTKDYYIGVYEVTQRQYEHAVGVTSPAGFNGAAFQRTRPVENATYALLRGKMTWPVGDHTEVTASSAIGKFRSQTGITSFDLPLEAQWEFACQAGCGETLYSGVNLVKDDTEGNREKLGQLARFLGNCGGTDWNTVVNQGKTDVNKGTATVGSYPANRWGLYDMLGNVAELCLDLQINFTATNTNFDPEVGPTKDQNGKSGSDAAALRVRKGGSWWDDVANSLGSSRLSLATNSSADMRYGFRLVCDAVAP